MKFVKELFVIPNKDTFFVYAPLRGVVMEVNKGMVNLMRQIQEGGDIPRGLEDNLKPLIENKLLIEKEDNSEKPSLPIETETQFKPTKGTLMITSDCNLRCVYCYGTAGIDPHTIEKETALAAIDFLVNNTLEKNSKKIKISLHGGGEPLLYKNWQLLTEIVKNIKEKVTKNGLEIIISTGTNGVLSTEQLGWVKQNINHVEISLDGTEDIQNKQRPMADGRESYPFVMSTIRYFEEHDVGYGLRATITRESVGKMEQIVDFFHTISNKKVRFHFEPLSECGRCSITHYKSPHPNIFLKNLIKAIEKSESYSRSIHYSGKRFGSVTRKFCGAAGRNFCVTPEGDVTSCYEVTRRSDPRSEKFFFGKYDKKSGNFIIDMGKLNLLKSRTVENVPHCESCYAKYTCAGDCLAKVETSKSMFDPSRNPRCIINQKILKYEIANKLRRGKDEKAIIPIGEYSI